MNFDIVMNELEQMGTEQNRKIYRNHGADLDIFGVSISNLKKLLKNIKNDNELGWKLFESNNVDAIYLSQWVIDPNTLTISSLESLMNSTNYYLLIDNVVSNLLIGNKKLAWLCLEKWIDHENHIFRQAAYSLYSLILGTYSNDEIDSNDVKKRLYHIEKVIHSEANRVRYNMNNFVISAGIYNLDLTDLAKRISKTIGKVKVNVGLTSCKVPDSFNYIVKVEQMNRIGKKRK